MVRAALTSEPLQLVGVRLRHDRLGSLTGGRQGQDRVRLLEDQLPSAAPARSSPDDRPRGNRCCDTIQDSPRAALGQPELDGEQSPCRAEEPTD